MKIKYIDEKGNLLLSTEDYVPNVDESINIDNIDYEISDRKINIIALHTEINIYLVEKTNG